MRERNISHFDIFTLKIKLDTSQTLFLFATDHTSQL